MGLGPQTSQKLDVQLILLLLYHTTNQIKKTETCSSLRQKKKYPKSSAEEDTRLQFHSMYSIRVVITDGVQNEEYLMKSSVKCERLLQNCERTEVVCYKSHICS